METKIIAKKPSMKIFSLENMDKVRNSFNKFAVIENT